jgi:hypothetical protein
LASLKSATKKTKFLSPAATHYWQAGVMRLARGRGRRDRERKMQMKRKRKVVVRY